MNKLTCEICGGTEIVKQDGVFVCQTCGAKYSLEEVRKMLTGSSEAPAGAAPAAPAAPDNSKLISNYLTMARNALTASNNEEAESYSNKIIELDPTQSEAWLIKGESAAWQSRANNDRLSEATLDWINAITYAKEEDKPEIRQNVAGKFANVFEAMVNLRANNFSTIQSKENLNATLNQIKSGIDLMYMLCMQAGVRFNRAPIFDTIGDKLNSAAVAGYKDAKKDFGPGNDNMAKWRWENFYTACDNCISLLETANKYIRNPETKKTIIENEIFIAKEARDSCSYKYNANIGGYTADYAFTDEAQKIRSNKIAAYEKEKQELLDNPIAKALDAVQGDRIAEAKKRAKAEYWEKNKELKEQLENEKSGHKKAIAEKEQQILEMPSYKALEDAKKNKEGGEVKLNNLESELAALGLFKAKEKKALQEKIDFQKTENSALAGALKEAEAQHKKESEKLQSEIDAANADIERIDNELNQEREPLEEGGKLTIPDAVVDGKINVTPKQLLENLKKYLPENYEPSDIMTSQIRATFADKLYISFTDKNKPEKRGGVSAEVFFVAESEDSPINMIVISQIGTQNVENNIDLSRIGSIVLQSIIKEIDQSNAECLFLNAMYSEKGVFASSEDGISTEFFVYNDTLLTLPIEYSGLLIRGQNC